MDVGEMFLNCWFQTVLCPYAGVNVFHTSTTEDKVLNWDAKRPGPTKLNLRCGQQLGNCAQ